MKKIFALILCAMLICATPVVAFAEGEETATEVTENITVEEIVTESEISAPEQTIPDKIATFFSENFEGTSFISLAVTIVGYVFYEIKKHRKLDGSIGTLNNNAITIAKNSTETIKDAMEKVADIAEVVTGYKDEMASMIAEIRKNAEEKQSLEDMLQIVQKTLETSKMASKELADEVAELLVLANIPPSKKEELYARHRAAVNAIATAENTEVITNDGKET